MADEASGTAQDGSTDGTPAERPRQDSTAGTARTRPAGTQADAETEAADLGETPADEAVVGPVERRSAVVRDTNRWVGTATLAFVAAGLGILLESRGLLLATVVAVGYLAYANGDDAPDPSLTVGRRLSDPRPEPGDEVTVTVVVENASEGVLTDLRLVEQVPAALQVVDGPARTATALRPGARATFSYTVRARRGEWAFDGLTAIARNASGSRERELDLATATTAFTCLPPQDATSAVPLRALTAPYTGRVSTDNSGEGVEFASLREYQHGDPLSRLDWNRYARDGALATMEFREERMGTVVVLLDLRPSAYVRGGESGRHAVDQSIDAARRIVNSLLDTGDRVGLDAFAAEDVWLAPSAGPTHRARARHLLATHPALSPTPPDDRVYLRTQLRRLLKRLSDEDQVVFVSPVRDDTAAYVATSLQVRGHPVTVVSPDPTTTDTPGRTLAHVQRSNRLNDLRTSGVRVVDWGPDESLTAALERARRRWSA